MPKISFVMPCYNYGNYLAEAIDSALAQTFTDFELVIVDDCSNDGKTPAIIAEQAKRDKRIRAIFSEQNNGAAASYNIAIKNAKGKYIFPLDADDIIDPTLLEKTITAMEKENADVAYVNYKLFGAVDGFSYFASSQREIKRLLPFKNRVPGCSLYKKADWEEVGGYDEKLTGYEDWDFWLYFFEAGKKFVLVDEVLYHQRMHEGSVNYEALKINDELRQKIKQNHPNLYRWYNYYFTFTYFWLVARRGLFQLRLRKGRRIFRLFGITFFKDE